MFKLSFQSSCLNPNILLILEQFKREFFGLRALELYELESIGTKDAQFNDPENFKY